MSKKLIICCDGTGNEIKEHQSNVLKFYRLLNKDFTDTEEKQIVFYDAGVGTISDSNSWSRLKTKAKSFFGLAFGYGLDRNVMDAYKFLVSNYNIGDKIYLFGFSRGAYTARVLAGFIHMTGMLKPEQIHLLPYALIAYKKAYTQDDASLAYRFNEVLDTYRPTIDFMGCWDTVSSVFVPRSDRLYLPAMQELPFTNNNPSVKVFRHAIAVDEKRTMFRPSLWNEPQIYKKLPYYTDAQGKPQDIKQLWFAGVHSDIGGGYPEDESGLAKITLKWMVDEAQKHGLVFRKEMIKRLVNGKNPANSKRQYCAPDPLQKLHKSLTTCWLMLEIIPKYEATLSNLKKHWHIPLASPRVIPADATIHESVNVRKKGNGSYEPPNLPD